MDDPLLAIEFAIICLGILLLCFGYSTIYESYTDRMWKLSKDDEDGE